MRNQDENVGTSSGNAVAGLWLTLALAALATACGGDGTCFSPTQNLDHAYDSGAVGCPCTPGLDKDMCIADSTGRRVALLCEAGKWHAVEDGPCEP
jgi:hypothetical protein